MDIPGSVWTAEELQLRRFEDEVAAGLMDVLDMKFNPPFSCDTEEHIAKTYRNANTALDRGDIEEARFLMLVPAKLLQCLVTVQEYDEDLLQEFKREFHEVEFDRYYGVRCEVETARSLLKHGLGFKHPDPPDFLLTYEGVDLSIECTSIHIESSTDYRQKVCDVIGGKDGNYSGDLTTLFIDITNILHHSFEAENKITKKDLKKWIAEDAEIFGWEIGSILLWSYVYDNKTERFHHAYIRSDTPNIGVELEDFLGDYYPLGKFGGDEFEFPSQG